MDFAQFVCCLSQTFSEQFDVHSAVLESTKRARDVDHDEKKRKKLEVRACVAVSVWCGSYTSIAEKGEEEAQEGQEEVRQANA